MNLHNTVVFFGVGFVIELLPRLAVDAVGSETRVLWLAVMGAVMMAIGGAYLIRMAWETLPREKYYAAVRTVLQEEGPLGPMDAETDRETRTHA